MKISIYSGKSSSALRSILIAEEAAMLALPRPASFNLFLGSAEERAAALASHRAYGAALEAIEADTIAKVRALAEAGDIAAVGFLSMLERDQSAEATAAWHGRYAGDY